MAINYNRGMSQRGTYVTAEMATGLVRRHLLPDITVTEVRKLYGGSVNRVLEFVIDRHPGAIVAKIHDRTSHELFEVEAASLRYFQDKTRLPVPMPLSWFNHDETFDGAVLFMQKIPGTTLEAAHISRRGNAFFQTELASHLIELHSHTAESFGSAVNDEDRHETWLDYYRPSVEREVGQTRSMLPSSLREVVDHVCDHLAYWLSSDSPARPTLIHGDLWANNILISDAHPDQPRIQAYIDGHASFADPEYELAYLRLFKTAGDPFFNVYGKTHRVRPGFERRCRVYWLITMLQHCRMFGAQYLPSVERIAKEIRAMSR
ncbi:MAG: fructosamine kinase family protein [Planctomycetota bacterium]